MTRPDFVVIGEQKAGTGWLRDRLNEHPEVFCYPREVNFFNRKSNFAKGLGWYAGLFERRGTKTIAGEKSPDYFWIGRESADYFANPLVELDAALPEARIVLCLRHPVDRAISAANHHLYQRGRRIDPWQARTRPLADLLFEPSGRFERDYGVIARGFYAERLRIARELFGERLLVLLFEEDIVGDPSAGMARVCAHLGVRPEVAHFDFTNNNKSRKPSFVELALTHHMPVLRPVLRRLPTGTPFRLQPDAQLVQRLTDLYADDMRRTLALLGRASGGWPTSRAA